MHGRERAVVARVHRLQHVERLAAADFAQHDAIGTHTQAVANEVTLRDCASPFDVGRARLQPHHMRLLHLQLGGVLDRHDAFRLRDEAGKQVEQRRFAGAGAARDHHIQASAHDRAHHLRDR